MDSMQGLVSLFLSKVHQYMRVKCCVSWDWVSSGSPGCLKLHSCRWPGAPISLMPLLASTLPSLFSAGDQTQGIVKARDALYHVSHSPSQAVIFESLQHTVSAKTADILLRHTPHKTLLFTWSVLKDSTSVRNCLNESRKHPSSKIQCKTNSKPPSNHVTST